MGIMMWKVRWSQGFRISVYKYLGKQMWKHVKRFLKELEKSLNKDPSTLTRLKRNPVVFEYRWVRRKRGVVTHPLQE